MEENQGGSPEESADRIVSQTVEDYIKAIYELQGKADRVSTSDIARVLGTSPASVTKMSKYLSRQNLLTHEPYYGVRLTAVGEKIALETIRHHRLIELYLFQALGYSWDQVDAEAERLEHHISEEFEERIDQILGRPQTDPHGDPIPTRDGILTPIECERLDAVPPGEALTVVRVSDSSSEALRTLTQIGVHLGARIELVGQVSPDTAVVVKVNGQEKQIESALTTHIFVKPSVLG